MVLGEVGERRHRKTRAPGAQQIERVGAHFHGDHIDLRIAHTGEQTLQVRRLRRGVSGLLMHVSHIHANRPDDAGATTRNARDVLHKKRSGGLAVGARHANQRNVVRGVIVEDGSGMRHRLARVGNNNLRHIGRVCQIDLALNDQHLCATVDRILRKGMPVDLHAHDAEEHIARLYRIAAVSDAGNLFLRIAQNGAIQTLEQLGACLRHSAPLCEINVSSGIIALRRDLEAIDCHSHYIFKHDGGGSSTRNLGGAHKTYQLA